MSYRIQSAALEQVTNSQSLDADIGDAREAIKALTITESRAINHQGRRT
jgi:hypothetical protein